MHYDKVFAALGAHNGRATALGDAAAAHFPAAGIDAPLRLAHFLAQAAHETGGFQYFREIWGPTAAQRGYEGRADLGNTHPGDGARYMGRGVFQLTGRANYQEYGALMSLDIVSRPELLEAPNVALWSATLFWTKRGLNTRADADDIQSITRRINGGLNGLDDRMRRLVAARAALELL